MYEITFDKRPLGFSVIGDKKGKNAIIASIQDTKLSKMGVTLASMVHGVNGIQCRGMRHNKILKILTNAQCPFLVTFQAVLYQLYTHFVKKKMATTKKIIAQIRMCFFLYFSKKNA